jgi:four helix bundle protein
MSEQSEALKERTMLFALRVLRLIDRFPDTTAARVISYQLAKCSTSVGANYRAVRNARSKAEFIAKLGTVVEEAEESVYWLEIVNRLQLAPGSDAPAALQESIALRAASSVFNDQINAQITNVPMPQFIIATEAPDGVQRPNAAWRPRREVPAPRTLRP